jgi:hypothetical protein
VPEQLNHQEDEEANKPPKNQITCSYDCKPRLLEKLGNGKDN